MEEPIHKPNEEETLVFGANEEKVAKSLRRYKAMARDQWALVLIAVFGIGSLGIAYFTFAASGTSYKPYGVIESPTPSRSVSQTFKVSGWALDNQYTSETAISSVRIYIDNVYKASAVLGDPRSDICAKYTPARPGCPNVGWHYNLDTTTLTSAVHQVKAVITDKDHRPHSYTTPNVSFTVNNSSSSSSGGSSFSSIYGNPYSPNSLSNLRLGDNYNYKAAFRFRADHTGQLDGFRVYWVDSDARAGYSDGNGGTIQISVQNDDGTAAHFPSTTVLGQPLIWKPALTDTLIGAVNPGGNAARFQYIKFTSPIPVTQGQLYHLVFVNVDPSYIANFISVNGLVMGNKGVVSPYGVKLLSGLASVDWGVSYATNVDPWLNASPETNGNDFAPILDLGWTDGHHLGNGYMEVWTSKLRTLTASGNVREQFTPKSSKTVNKLTLSAVAVTSGTISFKLETATGSIVQQAQTSTVGDGQQHWYSFVLPLTTLSAGQQYNLIVGAPSGSAQIYAIRDGNRDPFNFDPATTFSDGLAQELKAGVWTNWEDEWSTVAVDYADLSFYFSLVQ